MMTLSPRHAVFDTIAAAWFSILELLDFKITYQDAQTIAMYTLAIAEALTDTNVPDHSPQKSSPSRARIGNPKGSNPAKVRSQELSTH